MPAITGRPIIDMPQLLEWPTDRGVVEPSLNDPTSNTLFDLHGETSFCDLLLSTEGNYHPACTIYGPFSCQNSKTAR
jgi:hypothetical protein